MSKICVVTQAFEANSDNTLTLPEGVTVEVLSDLNPNWWYVRSLQDSTEGYFPATCLLQQTSAEKPLPPGWQKHFDSNTNRYYYFNISTNKTQWTAPDSKLEEIRPLSASIATSNPSKESTDPLSKSANFTIGTSLSRQSSQVQQSPTKDQQLPTLKETNSEKSSPATSVKSFNSVKSPAKPPQPPPPPPRRNKPTHPPPPLPQKRASIAKVEGQQNSDDNFRMSDELKEEISRFSIRGYAAEHFSKKKKKWGVFRRKTVKNSERKMGYTTKLSQPLTVISKELHKSALLMFQNIYKYMDKNDREKDRGEHFFALISNYESLRPCQNGLLEELYCQLIQQTTDNPNAMSLERGWEVLAVLTLSGLYPQDELVHVLIGHADTYRFCPSATGAFAIATHSAVCLHVKALRNDNQAKAYIQLPILSDVNYEKDVVPLRSMHITHKVFGVDVHGALYRELFLHKENCVFPTGNSIGNSVPEILKLLCTYILEKGGKTRQGIFREAANTEVVKELLQQLEVGNYQALWLSENQGPHICSYFPDYTEELIGDKNMLKAPPIPIDDVLIVADVLKIWFRKMPEPITTFSLYDACIEAGKLESPQLAQRVVEQIPQLNANVLKYLAQFMRELSKTSHITNMEVVNLSLVFAPNCIRSPNPDPELFAANANFERKCFKLFIDTLAPL